MNGNNPHSPVVFDKANRELRTVRFFFRKEDDVVLSIKWEAGVHAGTAVQPQQKLAQIRWEMQDPQDIVAPPGCSGTVEKTNRRIAYEKLARDSQLLLSLHPA